MTRFLVDALNVINVRPAEWPVDRAGAVRELVARIRRLAERSDDAFVVVVDGKPVDDVPPGGEGAVRVVYARRGGPDAADDAIIDLIERDRDPGSITVVTADKALRNRARKLGARVEGPASLAARLDRPHPP